MPKFDTVKPGDVLYDVHRARMGNTTMSRLDYWAVYVESVDYDNYTAMCKWNGNPAQMYCKRRIERLRRSKPKAKGDPAHE
jgi:hypothetical protein